AAASPWPPASSYRTGRVTGKEYVGYYAVTSWAGLPGPLSGPGRYSAGVGGCLGSYPTLGLLVAVAVVFFVVAFGANRLLRPSNPTNGAGKFDTYECGLDPVGGGWAQVHIRYYLYAYLYLL